MWESLHGCYVSGIGGRARAYVMRAQRCSRYAVNMSETLPPDAISEVRNWLLGGVIALAAGGDWVFSGWFVNGDPDFSSFLVVFGGANSLSVGGLKALRLAARDDR